MKTIYNRSESIKLNISNYESYFGSLNEARARCFNIGAGTWFHDAWTNIDLPAQTKEFEKIQAPCIAHNLVEDSDLPIEPNTADMLYTSHVIEHIPDETVHKLFKSAYQVLRTGGIFRVTTGPDADLDLDALVRGDLDWWYFYHNTFDENLIVKYGNPSVYDFWLYHLATPRSIFSPTPCAKKYSSRELVDLLSVYDGKFDSLRDFLSKKLEFNIASPGDHISWWNKQKLVNSLRNAGFSNVRVSGYGQSNSMFMRDLSFFDQTYPQITCYVEAIK